MLSLLSSLEDGSEDEDEDDGKKIMFIMKGKNVSVMVSPYMDVSIMDVELAGNLCKRSEDEKASNRQEKKREFCLVSVQDEDPQTLTALLMASQMGGGDVCPKKEMIIEDALLSEFTHAFKHDDDNGEDKDVFYLEEKDKELQNSAFLSVDMREPESLRLISKSSSYLVLMQQNEFSLVHNAFVQKVENGAIQSHETKSPDEFIRQGGLWKAKGFPELFKEVPAMQALEISHREEREVSCSRLATPVDTGSFYSERKDIQTMRICPLDQACMRYGPLVHAEEISLNSKDKEKKEWRGEHCSWDGFPMVQCLEDNACLCTYGPAVHAWKFRPCNLFTPCVLLGAAGKFLFWLKAFEVRRKVLCDSMDNLLALRPAVNAIIADNKGTPVPWQQKEGLFSGFHASGLVLSFPVIPPKVKESLLQKLMFPLKQGYGTPLFRFSAESDKTWLMCLLLKWITQRPMVIALGRGQYVPCLF